MRYSTIVPIWVQISKDLDPNLGVYYWARRDWQRAAEKFKIALELGYESAHGSLIVAYGMMKLYDQMDKEAEAYARYTQDIWPRARTYIDVLSAYFKGDKETVRRLLPELEAHPNNFQIYAKIPPELPPMRLPEGRTRQEYFDTLMLDLRKFRKNAGNPKHNLTLIMVSSSTIAGPFG